MDKNTPLTFDVFEEYFITYMEQFRRNQEEHLDGGFHNLETSLKQYVSKTVEDAIEELALITKTGFDDMDRRFLEIHQEISEIKQDVSVLKTDMNDCKRYIQSASIESGSNRVRLQNLEARIA